MGVAEDGVGGVGDVSHNKVEDGFCQGVGIAASHHDVVEGGEDEDGVGDDGGHHNVKSKAKLW